MADPAAPTGRLSVVATPIGNLGDLSARAREVLAGCELIAAEDTRHTRALLRHFGIDTPLLSLHQHNERQRIEQLLARLRGGAHVALVSDAGTPAISDPGLPLVRACAQAGVRIQVVPGPCAAIAALSVAGLPTDRFCFEGFLPAAAGARAAVLRRLADERRTLVFYESPHRIAEALGACVAAFGAERPAVLARELTKQFETLYRGSLEQLSQSAQRDADLARGEIVLIIEGAPAGSQERSGAELDRVLGILLPELSLKQAATLAARLTGCRDNEVYRRALQLRQANEMD
ncbi:MAG: 16S rRNA (cytidine(1402)-2'-O)-methyltransferase [Proteobacteria bacterium]|nr:16S rRNA (cytidine(1402)-2'-O)-methyltransferase [Pseudomonadota bacterium]